MKNVVVFLITCAQSTLAGIFVFYEADSFREYVESVFVFSTLVVVSVTFFAFIWITAKMFKLMNNIETTVNKSEWSLLNYF